MGQTFHKLFISFISADSVKATTKTTKALVRNGTCKWGDPIYETTRLFQNTRIKQYDEKLYKIVIAMGTSRSSILGEAMINLADYADALIPFAVVLLLQGCDAGAILPVTVQLLTSKTGFREFEQQRKLRERGPSATPVHSSLDEATLSHVNEAHVRGGFKEKLWDDSLVEEAVGSNDLDLGLRFDVSSNTSVSLNAEKHDISSKNEIDSIKSVVSGDLSGLAQSPRKEKDGHKWQQGWGSDYLGKNSELGNAIADNNKLKGFLEDMESSIASINEIKIEVKSLQCHADDEDAFTEALPEFLSPTEPCTSNMDMIQGSMMLDSDEHVGLEDAEGVFHEKDTSQGKGLYDEVFYEVQGGEFSDSVSVVFLTRSTSSYVYNGIDTQMSIHMSKLEFFCSRPTVVALIGFGFDLYWFRFGDNSVQQPVTLLALGTLEDSRIRGSRLEACNFVRVYSLL